MTVTITSKRSTLLSLVLQNAPATGRGGLLTHACPDVAKKCGGRARSIPPRRTVYVVQYLTCLSCPVSVSPKRCYLALVLTH